MRTIRTHLFLALALPLLVALDGCRRRESAQTQLPTIQTQIGNRTFTLELARTDPDRQHGLMNRDSMPIDHGMLFIFAVEAPRSFWMKSTRIALDILYLDAQGKVVDVKTMQPLDLRAAPSRAPAKYAIEINAGAATLANVKIGDVINIPPEAREPSN